MILALLFLLFFGIKFSNSANQGCTYNFEGFGIHLGGLTHFNMTPDQEIIQKVIHNLYYDLKLRHFRTSFEPSFSNKPHEYDISCRDQFSCPWNDLHRALTNLPQDFKIFASVWSPPLYMKNHLDELIPGFEQDYYYYLKNITDLISINFGQEIELISPVNEPENILAIYEHLNMGPNQLCQMVMQFNDEQISGCPENSHYWMTKLYFNNLKTLPQGCTACKTVLTHTYSIDTNPISPNFLAAHYDLREYPEYFQEPVWMSEVSTTYGTTFFENNQMGDALDLATNIANFIGITCVTRYYFWLAYTLESSGESLMWGQWKGPNISLVYPKKYFVYRHFTLAHSKMTSPGKVNKTMDGRVHVIQFGNASKVFINLEETPGVISVEGCFNFCCTDIKSDYNCTSIKGEIPQRSVCSCSLTSDGNTPRTIINFFKLLMTILEESREKKYTG